MAITFVNGYQCSNCTDIDNAKKHVDPAHPQDGPYGVNAPKDSGRDRGGDITTRAVDATGNSAQPAVIYGGSLAALNPVAQSGATPPPPQPSQTPDSRPYRGSPGSGFSLTV